MNKARLYWLICAALLSGCAHKYVQEADDSKSASLTVFHKTESFPSATWVDAYDNPECKPSGNYGRAATAGKANDLSVESVTIRIGAGNTIYLKVRGWTKGPSTYTYGIADHFCTNLAGFSPEAGKAYTLVQEILPGNR